MHLSRWRATPPGYTRYSLSYYEKIAKKTIGRCNKKLFSDELDFMEPSSNQELNLPEVFEYPGRDDEPITTWTSPAPKI
jgi:hypothetical protein